MRCVIGSARRQLSLIRSGLTGIADPLGLAAPAAAQDPARTLSDTLPLAADGSVRIDDNEYDGAVNGGGPRIQLEAHEGRFAIRTP